MFSLGSVLAFAASGAAPFSGGPGVSSASVMYRIVYTSPGLSTVPVEIRELVQACLAKEPAWRPDLGQVAARCAAAAENLGMSPAVFWPSDVAGVIDAQHAALAADVRGTADGVLYAIEAIEDLGAMHAFEISSGAGLWNTSRGQREDGKRRMVLHAAALGRVLYHPGSGQRPCLHRRKR